MKIPNESDVIKLKSYLHSLGLDISLIKDEHLLVTSFIHKSFSSDYKESIEHNERLEFLGDAILGFVIAKILYLNYPNHEESKLTLFKIALIREETLAQVAIDIGLNQYLFLSNGEERAGGRNKSAIISDGLEALIGYIYLDLGIDSVEFFINKYIYTRIDNLTIDIKSSKSQLQELIQKKYKVLPDYEDIEIEFDKKGNVKKYLTIVKLNGKKLGEGTGTSKKRAQENAAKNALKALK